MSDALSDFMPKFAEALCGVIKALRPMIDWVSFLAHIMSSGERFCTGDHDDLTDACPSCGAAT